MDPWRVLRPASPDVRLVTRLLVEHREAYEAEQRQLLATAIADLTIGRHVELLAVLGQIEMKPREEN